MKDTIIATIAFDEALIKRICTAQYYTFNMGKRLIMYIFSIGLILAGVFIPWDQFSAIVAVFCGCWLFWTVNTPIDLAAEKMTQKLQNDWPLFRYCFLEDHVLVKERGEYAVGYSEIQRVILHDDHLFFFIDSKVCFPLSCKSLSDQELKSLLDDRIGKTAENMPTLLNIRPQAILQLFAKRFQGKKAI